MRGLSARPSGTKNSLRNLLDDAWGWYDRRQRRARDLPCGNHRIYLELEVRRVQCRRCGGVKGERLESFLENALHTERFARYVGKRCRSGTIKDVAEELNLDWHTVKRLEKHYMREQLKRCGAPRPKVIGIETRSRCAKDTNIASW